MASANNIKLQRHIPAASNASISTPNTSTSCNDKAYRGWNWGAFSLSVPFGVVYGISKCYFTLIPLFGIIWAVVCGFNGSSWAFGSGHFASVKDFNSSMTQWNKIGIVTFVSAVIGVVAHATIALLVWWMLSLPSVNLLDLMTASS